MLRDQMSSTLGQQCEYLNPKQVPGTRLRMIKYSKPGAAAWFGAVSFSSLSSRQECYRVYPAARYDIRRRRIGREDYES
jgi:hypothetical protein